MRLVLGLLSLVCFAAAFMGALVLLLNPRNLFVGGLVVVIALGLAVVFRGVAGRMAK